MAKSRRPAEDIDRDRLAELAELYTGVEDAAVLLEIDPDRLQEALDDTSSPLSLIWRTGRAQARLKIRTAQFSLMTTNASLAVHLGRELLGQDGGAAVETIVAVIDTGIFRDAGDTDTDGVRTAAGTGCAACPLETIQRAGVSPPVRKDGSRDQ